VKAEVLRFCYYIAIMLDFQQKWKAKSFLYSRGVRIFLAIVALYSIYSTYTVYKKKQESAGDVVKAEQRLLALSAKNTVLLEDIDRLQTEEGLEAEIRNKYSVAKGSEQVVVLVEEEPLPPATTTEEKSIWSKFKGFFGF
jgi:cell division protein FtsB